MTGRPARSQDQVVPRKAKTTFRMVVPDPAKTALARVPLPTSLQVKKSPPRSVAKFAEKLLACYAPHLLPEAMEQLRIALVAGEASAIRDTLTAYGLLGGKQGGVVFQNIVNANATANAQAAAVTSSARGFDSFMRRKAEAEQETKIIDAIVTP